MMNKSQIILSAVGEMGNPCLMLLKDGTYPTIYLSTFPTRMRKSASTMESWEDVVVLFIFLVHYLFLCGTCSYL